MSGNLVEPLILEKDIERHVKGTPDIEKAVNNLISTAYQRGSTDNITTALLEVGVLKRSEDIVNIETDVEVLRKQELKQKEKIIRGRHRKSSYRRLIPILVIMVCLLCLTILIIHYRHSKPVPQPTNVLQVKTSPVESPVHLPTQPSAPNNAEPMYIKWSNYTEGKVEQCRLDEIITFNLYNYDAEVIEVILHGSPNRSMEPITLSKDVKQWLNGPAGNVPLKAVAGLKKGIRYLQVYLKTINNEVLRSEPMEIEIVGQ